MTTPTPADLLDAPERGLELDATEAARLLARVEGLAAVLRLAAAPSAVSKGNGTELDEMLNAEQAAARTGMSKRLLYKKAKAGELPFAERVSARKWAFSARGIERWHERLKRGKTI